MTGTGAAWPRPRPWQFAAALVALLLLTGALAYGLAGLEVRPRMLWSQIGLHRLLWFTGVYFIAAALYAVAARHWFLTHVGAAGVLYALMTAGSGGAVAVALFAAASFSLGDLLLRRLAGAPARSLMDIVIRSLAGAGLYVFATGLAAHFPVNVPLVYWAAQLAMVWVNRRALLDTRRILLRRAPASRMSLVDYGSGALLGYALFIQLIFAVKPDVSFDGMAMHLALPGYVARNWMWSFDFRNIGWALMPMAGDWAFVITYMTGGEPGVRLLNYAMLCAASLLLARSAKRIAGRWPALLLTALFVSAPITHLETGSLFVENFFAAMLAGAVVSLNRLAATRKPVYFYSCAVLAGTLAATKLGGIPVALAVAAGAAMFVFRKWIPITFPRAAASFLFIAIAGGYQYVYAYWVSGSPIFPFPNSFFHSPHFTVELHLSFKEPLTWRTLYDMTFESQRFLEGIAGALGFHYLLLIPLGLLFVFRAPRIAMLSYLFAAVLFFSVMPAQPYIRYIYPAMPLFLISSATAFTGRFKTGILMRRTLAAILVPLLFLNVLYMPAAGASHVDFSLPLFDVDGVRKYLESAGPVRALVQHARTIAPNELLVFLRIGHVGAYDGPALTNNWHHHRFLEQVLASRTPEAVAALMRKTGARYFILAPELQDEALSRFVRQYTTELRNINGWVLARYTETPRTGGELLVNGDFRDGLSGWQKNGAPIYSAADEVGVTVTDNVLQRVYPEPGRSYRFTMRARCEGSKNQLRLQVNYHNATGDFIGADIRPHSCGNEYKEFTSDMRVPLEAASGVLYVTGHTAQRVWVDRVGLQP